MPFRCAGTQPLGHKHLSRELSYEWHSVASLAQLSMSQRFLDIQRFLFDNDSSVVTFPSTTSAVAKAMLALCCSLREEAIVYGFGILQERYCRRCCLLERMLVPLIPEVVACRIVHALP